jgi:ketosteroid isomerase-like protein
VVERAKRTVGKDGPPLGTDEDSRIAVVRDALKAFGSGEWDDFVGAMDEGVQWMAPAGENFPGAGTQEGHAAIHDNFIADVRRTYDTFGFVPQIWLEGDERNWVVVIGQFAGEAAEGREFEAPAVLVWEFESAKVARVRIYADTADFPTLITEARERELEEEAEKEEAEPKGGGDGDGATASAEDEADDATPGAGDESSEDSEADARGEDSASDDREGERTG